MFETQYSTFAKVTPTDHVKNARGKLKTRAVVVPWARGIVGPRTRLSAIIEVTEGYLAKRKTPKTNAEPENIAESTTRAYEPKSKTDETMHHSNTRKAVTVKFFHSFRTDDA